LILFFFIDTLYACHYWLLDFDARARLRIDAAFIFAIIIRRRQAPMLTLMLIFSYAFAIDYFRADFRR